jgi:hypothetical protein
LDWAAKPGQAPDAGQARPFDSASAGPAQERLLAAYQTRIEEKNKLIASLESWAGDMEARLKAKEAASFSRRLKARFKRRT